MMIYTEENNFSQKFYTSIMPLVYNIGATVVILGAMFKLLNLPGGSIMLGVGLSTEALIFFLSAFEPKDIAQTTSNVPLQQTPHLTQKLDECLQQAQIDNTLLDNLATSMRSFSENIAQVPSFNKLGEVTKHYINSTEQAIQAMGEVGKINHIVNNTLHTLSNMSSEKALSDYVSQLQDMTQQLTLINGLYKQELNNIKEKRVDYENFYKTINHIVDTLQDAGSQAMNFKNELTSLNEKVTALNTIYSKTLGAFKD